MSRYHRRQAGAEAYRRRKWLEKQTPQVQAQEIYARWLLFASVPASLLGLLMWGIPALRGYVLSFWPGITSCALLIGGLLWALQHWEP
jgi:hypothetical protein